MSGIPDTVRRGSPPADSLNELRRLQTLPLADAPRPAPSPPTTASTSTTDTGDDVQLFRLSRGAKGDLVLRLRSYEGHPYLDIRMFEHGRPTPKGTSIRVRELPALIDALVRAQADVDADRGGGR